MPTNDPEPVDDRPLWRHLAPSSDLDDPGPASEEEVVRPRAVSVPSSAPGAEAAAPPARGSKVALALTFAAAGGFVLLMLALALVIVLATAWSAWTAPLY